MERDSKPSWAPGGVTPCRTRWLPEPTSPANCSRPTAPPRSRDQHRSLPRLTVDCLTRPDPDSVVTAPVGTMRHFAVARETARIASIPQFSSKFGGATVVLTWQRSRQSRPAQGTHRQVMRAEARVRRAACASPAGSHERCRHGCGSWPASNRSGRHMVRSARGALQGARS